MSDIGQITKAKARKSTVQVFGCKPEDMSPAERAKAVTGYQLRHRIEALVAGITQKKIKHSYYGDGACTNDDIMVLPSIPQTWLFRESDAKILLGYTVHEISHHLETDFDVFKQIFEDPAKAKKSEIQLKNWWNAIEDYRIEKITKRAYPGFPIYINETRRHSGERFLEMHDEGMISPERLANPYAIGAVALTWIGERLNGYANQASQIALQKIDHDLRLWLESWKDDLEKVEEPEDALNLARAILQDLQQQDEEEEQSDKSDESQDGENSDNDDKNSGSGSSSDQNDAENDQQGDQGDQGQQGKKGDKNSKSSDSKGSSKGDQNAEADAEDKEDGGDEGEEKTSDDADGSEGEENPDNAADGNEDGQEAESDSEEADNDANADSSETDGEGSDAEADADSSDTDADTDATDNGQTSDDGEDAGSEDGVDSDENGSDDGDGQKSDGDSNEADDAQSDSGNDSESGDSENNAGEKDNNTDDDQTGGSHEDNDESSQNDRGTDDDDEDDDEASGGSSNGAGNQRPKPKLNDGDEDVETDDSDLSIDEMLQELAKHVTKEDRNKEDIVENPEATNQTQVEANQQEYARLRAELGPASARSAGVMRRLLQSQANVRTVRGLEEGRLDLTRLVPIVNGSREIYWEQHKTQAINTAVSVMVDNSYSMSGYPLEVCQKAAIVLDSAISGTGTDLEVSGFTGSSYKPIIYRYRAFGQKGQRAGGTLGAMQKVGLGGTPVSTPMLDAWRRLKEHKAPRKILIVITDGEAEDPQRTKQVHDLITFQGGIVVGIAIGRASMLLQWCNMVTAINDVDDLPKALTAIVQSLTIKRQAA